MTLLLSRTDTDGLVSMADVIEAIENAHADMSRGTAYQPAPTTLGLASSSGSFLPMAALADRQALAAVKFLADIPDNMSRGLPRQRSVLLLVSQMTGECEAIIDGRILTRQRTAATSAVASRFLARPDSRVLGLVGAGNLAVEHVKAIRVVLPIERVLVWSRTGATIAKFLERAREPLQNIQVEVMGSARDVVERSDVLCTLTPAREPVVLGEWFRAGLHINAVGAPPRPDHREIDSDGMKRAKVFVDSFATTMKKSGRVLLALADGKIAEDDVRRELGDIITGMSAGRTTPDEITLFDSVGIAMQDLAIGNLMVKRARSAGLGVDLDLAL